MSRSVPADVPVWWTTLNGSADSTVHLERGCAHLEREDLDEDRIEDGVRGDRPHRDVCRRCTGDWEPHKGDPWDRGHDALLEADPEDLDLSPLSSDAEGSA